MPYQKIMRKINVMRDDVAIIIEGKSADFWCQDLYTKAVVTLIENADVSEDTDDVAGYGIFSNTSEDFYASVLASIARSYITSKTDSSRDYEGVSIHSVLLELIDSLKDNSQLNDVVSMKDMDESEDE